MASADPKFVCNLDNFIKTAPLKDGEQVSSCRHQITPTQTITVPDEHRFRFCVLIKYVHLRGHRATALVSSAIFSSIIATTLSEDVYAPVAMSSVRSATSRRTSFSSDLFSASSPR